MVVCNEKVADREDSNPLICFTGFMTFICKVLLYPKSELSTLKASTGMVCLENRGFIGLPTSNHCNGQEQQSYVMGKSNSHPRISFRGTCSNICPWCCWSFLSFLPPLSTPTKHTFTLGRQRSDRPARQEKNIHSNFYSSFMQMTLVKLERSGI